MDRGAQGGGEARAGLVSLGLIMQLVGSIVAAYLIARALEPALARLFTPAGSLRASDFHFGNFVRQLGYLDADETRAPSPAWHLTLLAGMGIGRALLHRRAGSAILYRDRAALAAVSIYVAAAFLHTGLCLAFFFQDSTSPTVQWCMAALLGTIWPIGLLVAVTRPSFRRALGSGPAASTDTAPDEVATLMTFLGLVGALVALMAVYAALETWSAHDAIGSVAVLAVCLLLLARALAQLVAGVRVAGRAPGETAPRAAAGYVKIGLATSVLAGAALIIHLHGGLLASHEWYGGPREGWLFHHSFSASSLAHLGLVAYLIVLWPILLRRVVETRDRATVPSARESGESGAALAALGWLLLAAGSVQFAVAALELVAGPKATWAIWEWAGQYDAGYTTAVEPVLRSPWLQLLVVIPQLWTAGELLGGTTRRRTAATCYVACASFVTAFSIWDDLHYLTRTITTGLHDAAILTAHLQITFPLLVPIATLVFVERGLRHPSLAPPFDR